MTSIRIWRCLYPLSCWALLSLSLGPRVLKFFSWPLDICIYLRFAAILDLRTFNGENGERFAKPQSNSFLFEHQIEDHNGVPPDFKLQSKRYYGRDRLACQVAEGVSIKMRTGKILNSKTDWDAPSLITLERNIRRGLWLLWLQAITNFWKSCGVISLVCLVISFAFIFYFYFAVLSNQNLVMFEKARCAKHVTQIINFSK